MLPRGPRQVKLFSGSIQLRARFTGRLEARFTRSTDHSHSRRELCSWIRRRARPAVRSSWMRQAEIAATIHATRKCTKRFSKAGDTRKSFFDPTAWKGKLRRRDLLPLTCTDFWFYMAANTN